MYIYEGAFLQFSMYFYLYLCACILNNLDGMIFKKSTITVLKPILLPLCLPTSPPPFPPPLLLLLPLLLLQISCFYISSSPSPPHPLTSPPPLLFPSSSPLSPGWIHAVFTPEDTLVFEGNILHRYSIGLQLRWVWNQNMAG